MSQSIPDMFSYITIRKENFGGFLFNPYLINEVTLNQKEMRIAELCNGEYTIDEINSDIAQKFRIDQNQAEKNVHAALNRFNQYYAINWKNKKKRRCGSARCAPRRRRGCGCR